MVRRTGGLFMRYACSLAIGLSAILAAVPATAAQYVFNFSGQGRTASGTFTTSDTPAVARGGYSAVAITGISGMINGLTITGLNGFTGSDNLYYLTGPAFLDGSGVGFTASNGTQTSLFYQDSAPSYRITTLTGGFASGFVTASSSPAAVPEAATWAMMISGFGAVGAAMRRRRQLRTSFA